ncbi:unnamed protein product [Kluyveromyces dobzhanskii CBS 2104]|uniref:Cleavage and polyadenylation specificity factor subunit 2 n=1 Tax=Kluyveromyces dobzhanskii CBS 2104 TaxID=1427455 RepID=A0A0A8LAG4_9SACH|nr:unnamed protein product [Kluyveromyces dobzhanskii CBS 2104]
MKEDKQQVRFENVIILLDPGWNGEGSFDDCEQFWTPYISEIDIVLISQPTIECLGSYSMMFKQFLAHFRPRIQVYGTLPVSNLGRVNSIDLLTSVGILGPFSDAVMDLEDVESSFDLIDTVKYSQTVDLKSKFDGLSLEAHNSGYAPGGTIWTIITSSEKILYAPRWNHTRDTILNSADLLDNTGNPTSFMMHPTSVITDVSLIGSAEPQRKRAEHFTDTMKRAIQMNNSVLIPAEVGGKLLELVVLVNNFLYESKKGGMKHDIPVFLVSYSRGRSLTYAKSMLEWLSSQVVKTWESRDSRSPFDIVSRLRVVTPEGLGGYTGQKICLVSEVDDILSQTINKLCSKDKVTIILTERHTNTPIKHPLRKLNDKWQQAIKNGSRSALDGNPITVSDSMSLRIMKKTILNKKDADKVRETIKARNEIREKSIQEFTVKNNEVNAAAAILFDADDESSDEEGVGAMDARGKSGSTHVKVEVPVDITVGGDSTATGKHLMFQFHPVKIKSDDYGDVVNLKNFLPQEEPYDQAQSLKRSLNNSNDYGDEEDDDIYEVLDSRTRKSKNRKVDHSIRKQEDDDDITYLDPLKSDIYERTIVETKIGIRCSLVYIDLTSVVNARSISIIWPAIKPRKVIIIPSSATRDNNVITNLTKRNVDVLVTEFNKPNEMDTSVKAIDISIDPSLDQLLNWQRISRSFTVAHVVGKLVTETDPKVPHREKVILKPLNNPLALHSRSSLRIGDVRLPELKRRLTAENHKAEFQGEGTLVVDGKVSVRKINDAETIVDGSPSDVFYKVKSAVSDMLANV